MEKGKEDGDIYLISLWLLGYFLIHSFNKLFGGWQKVKVCLDCIGCINGHRVFRIVRKKSILIQ